MSEHKQLRNAFDRLYEELGLYRLLGWLNRCLTGPSERIEMRDHDLGRALKRLTIALGGKAAASSEAVMDSVPDAADEGQILRKLLLDADWVSLSRDSWRDPTLVIDGGAELTDAEADLCERIIEDRRRAVIEPGYRVEIVRKAAGYWHVRVKRVHADGTADVILATAKLTGWGARRAARRAVAHDQNVRSAG